VEVAQVSIIPSGDGDAEHVDNGELRHPERRHPVPRRRRHRRRQQDDVGPAGGGGIRVTGQENRGCPGPLCLLDDVDRLARASGVGDDERRGGRSQSRRHQGLQVRVGLDSHRQTKAGEAVMGILGDRSRPPDAEELDATSLHQRLSRGFQRTPVQDVQAVGQGPHRRRRHLAGNGVEAVAGDDRGYADVGVAHHLGGEGQLEFAQTAVAETATKPHHRCLGNSNAIGELLHREPD
jgi:hypothetical protein